MLDLPDRIRTSRVVLRSSVPTDVPAVFARLTGDAEVTRYLGWSTHVRAAQAAEMLSLASMRQARGVASTWVLESAGDVIGLVELVSQEAHAWRVGFLLQRASWGQGLMREALATLLALVQARSTTFRVAAVCDVDNPASARVLEAVGLQKEGCLRRFIVHPNCGPEPRDVWLYAWAR